jgi:hypothetical protein
MHWENITPQWTDLPDSEIPPELLDGLERLSHDAMLVKVRFRWRPHTSTATGFLTKDRLLDIRGAPIVEVARTVAAYATHLHDGGDCEGRFEAQVQREFEELVDERPKREWRSITFYVDAAADLRPNTTMGFGNHHDFGARDRAPRLVTKRSTLPSAPAGYDDYADFVELSRTDPTAFAMLVIQQSNDRLVSTLERLLDSSTGRLDGVLAQQGASSRYLNEAFQTLTKGAGDIASVGVQLFNQGLEGQARVARMEHDTELGKEHAELMRDAVKQGSLLAQAVLMANSAKRQRPSSKSARQRGSTRQRQRKGRRAAAASSGSPKSARATPTSDSAGDTASAEPQSSVQGSPTAKLEPVPAATEQSAVGRVDSSHEELPNALADDDAKSEADCAIEAQAERLFELLDDEVLDELEAVAPTLRAVFDELDGDQLEAEAIREIIARSQTAIDGEELVQAQALFEGELAEVFSDLVLRVLAGSMS